MYKIHYDDITSLQVEAGQTTQNWQSAIDKLMTSKDFIQNDPNLQGATMTNIGLYLSEVHGYLLDALGALMADYNSELLLYKDGYYTIDNDPHAVLSEQTLKQTHKSLDASKSDMEDELAKLDKAKKSVSDLVHYSGNKQTDLMTGYRDLMSKAKQLDDAVGQYESNHAHQDLSRFDAMVSAFESLLTEYKTKRASVTGYQADDIRRLDSFEDFGNAYNAIGSWHQANQSRLQAAGERDKARFEHLQKEIEAEAAKEREKQGWWDLATAGITVVVGVAAIVATAGAATPLVVAGAVAGAGAAAYGVSNMEEAGQNIYYGRKGDITTRSFNPIRDTVFKRNNELYHKVGGGFTLAASAMVPIGGAGLVKGSAHFAVDMVGGEIGQ